ncbi:MAG: hypothetical protein MUD12_13445 [Spirochaetes bacterium]|jgi:hypothetical protein|nr:hypothetical protein [Spirochaetota bacterium]
MNTDYSEHFLARDIIGLKITVYFKLAVFAVFFLMQILIGGGTYGITLASIVMLVYIPAAVFCVRSLDRN